MSCIYKHIQCNWPQPPPKMKFILPPLFMYSIKNDNTSDCGDSMIDLIRPLSISKWTTANMVDSDTNNGEDSQYFATTRKHYYGVT